MGAALSSNVDNMMTSVYNDSTETTNILNTNKNNSAQAANLDGCTLIANGSVNIKNSAKQAQNIMQQSTVSNSMIDTDNVNQNLLQNAQSKVSNWGIGLSSASNTANQVASITNSTVSAINVTNSNINNSFNTISCTDSTIIAGNDINLENGTDQTLISSQVTNAAAMTDITNNIKQSASQSAVATVSGVNLVGLIVAVIVLIVIVAIVLQMLKSKASNAKDVVKKSENIEGGKVYMLGGNELKLYCWCVVFIIILAVMGGLGLQQREQLRCDFDSQCQSDTFWFNAKSATCSCNGRDGCGTSVDPKALPELVPPPLFMCNAVEPDAGFGSNIQVNGLYPGSLQYMMVQNILSGAGKESSMRNNNGFNCGVFSQLLNMAENGVSGSTNITPFIRALVTYFQRQILTLGTNGRPLINTPNFSTSLNNWCAARIIQNLLPIQPSFAAPDTRYLCSQANTNKCIDSLSTSMCCPDSSKPGCNKTSTLMSRRTRLIRQAASDNTFATRKKKQRNKVLPLTNDLPSHRVSGIRLAVGLRNGLALKKKKGEREQEHAPVQNKSKAPVTKSMRRKNMRVLRTKRPGRTALAGSGTDCSLSGIPAPGQSLSGDIQYSTPAFNSTGNNNPSGFNLFADVCYKQVGENKLVFKTPTSCPSETCVSYPSDGSSMVVRVEVVNAGSKYSTDTTCSIVGASNNTSARGTVHVDDSGAIQGISIVNGGTGFYTPPSIKLSNVGSGQGAVLRTVLGTLCLDKDDTSKMCANRCGNGSDGWMAMPKSQATPLGNGNACTDTGVNAATTDSIFYQNGLWQKGVTQNSNSESRCYVAAGTGEGGYGNDTNQNKKYNQECATTGLNTNASAGTSSCQFRAIDNQLQQSVPAWMAAYVGYTGGTSVKPITVGISLEQDETSEMFYADLNDVAKAGTMSGAGSNNNTTLSGKTCGPDAGAQCNGEWGQGTADGAGDSNWSDSNQGLPDSVLQNSVGYSNAYCNAIAGICQKEDPGRADYDANCPAERQANYLYKRDGASAVYSSTCAQQPISGCGLYYMRGTTNPVGSEAHVCNTSNKGKCWSEGLCKAVNGVWTLDQAAGGFYCSDQPSCPAESLYNSEQGGMCMSCGNEKDCEASSYNNSECSACSQITDQASCTGGGLTGQNTKGYKTKEGETCICAWDEKSKQCSANVPFPNATGCTWSSAANGCIMGCTPGDNVCDNCSQDGCSAPCTWDGQVVRIDMTASGSGYTVGETTATITSSDGGNGAKVTVQVTSGIVTGITLTDGGSKYQDAPTIVISEGTGGKGSGFVGTVNVIDGIVDSITVVNGGSNYGHGNGVTVSLSGTKGTGFSGTVNYTDPTVSNGAIQSIKVNDGGYGYGPVVSIGGPGTGAKAKAVVKDGAIQSIAMVNSGQDYASAPSVTIKSLTGSGAKATAATASGAILGATVTNTGSGYPGTTGSATVSDKVTISFTGTGTGAAAGVVTQGSCFLGVNMCAQKDAIETELKDLYLVRIPGSFMASSASTITPAQQENAVNFGCLPNVFVPDVGNTNDQLFLGNCTSTYRTQYSSARSCCQTAAGQTIPSTFTTQDLYVTTCVSGDGSSAPTLGANYVCGCLDVSTGGGCADPPCSCYGDGVIDSSNTTTNAYSDDDMICYVNLNKASKKGGFILREASTISGSSNGNKVNTLYGTTETSPNPELYNYVAEASTNLVTWSQNNNTGSMRNRFYMFVRILYWILLTTETGEQTLSELGLSTFVNNLGYDKAGMKPAARLGDAGISAAAMYATQPLLVYDSDKNPLFFTLQELKEGMVDVSKGVVSSQRTPVPNADKYLAQITMWCYSPKTLGISSNVSSEGFNVSVPADGGGKDSGQQLSTADNLKGLMVGSTGHCVLWFTSDVFIGTTLGIACMIFAILATYAIVKNVELNKKR